MSYVAPTILAPGAHVELESSFAERWSASLAPSEHRVERYAFERFDLELRYTLTDRVGVGEGLALTRAERRDGEPALGGEARLVLFIMLR